MQDNERNERKSQQKTYNKVGLFFPLILTGLLLHGTHTRLAFCL